MSGKPVILCVDDEPNVLSGLRRTLRRDYEVVTAEGGQAGLEALASRDDFEVVICDMRMPEMNGAQFLAQAHDRWPQVTRMLLTGQADVESTVRAVNDGQIFRFLTKPTEPEALGRALTQAVEQHRLLRAELELTEGTVRGVVNVLVDVLSMVSPRAHASTGRVVDDVTEIAGVLALEDAWEFEVAAMLSSLGRVALSDDAIERLANGRGLSVEERTQVEQVPKIGGDLIAKIPRLESVSRMVRAQAQPIRREWCQEPWDRIGVGVGLLRAAHALEGQRARGLPQSEARAALLEDRGHHHPLVVGGIERLSALAATALAAAAPSAPQRIPIEGLRPGMVLEGDIIDGGGTLLVSSGYLVTEALVERLIRFRSIRDMPANVLVRAAEVLAEA